MFRVSPAPTSVRQRRHDKRRRAVSLSQPSLDWEESLTLTIQCSLEVYCQDAFDRLVRGGEDEIMYGHSADLLQKVGVVQRAFVTKMPVKLS